MNERRVWWVPLVCVAAGCFSGDWQKQYTKAVSDHRLDSQFSLLHPQPVSVAGGRIGVRVPRVFTEQVDPTAPPPRGRPAFLPDVPGFQAGFEFAAAAGAPPAILALGVVPKAERRREDVEAAILQQVRVADAKWEGPRDETARSGVVGRWKVLKVPGTGEVWISANDDQEFCNVLAWQVGQEAAAALPLEAIAPLVARSLEVLPPPLPVDQAPAAAAPAGS